MDKIPCNKNLLNTTHFLHKSINMTAFLLSRCSFVSFRVAFNYQIKQFASGGINNL